MKNKFNYSFALAFICTLLVSACVDETINPIPVSTPKMEIDKGLNTAMNKAVEADRIKKYDNDRYLLSWIIEDDVIIFKEEFNKPVLSLQTRENRMEAILLTSGGLDYIVTHEDLLLKQQGEHIIVIQDDVMLRIVIEDEVITKDIQPEKILAYIIMEDDLMRTRSIKMAN